MSNEIMLPEQGIGDVYGGPAAHYAGEDGDIDGEIGDIDLFPAEDGDAVVEYEQGAPRARKRKRSTLAALSRQAGKPGGREARAVLRKVHKTRGFVPKPQFKSSVFEDVRGGRLVTSSIGINATLRGAELDAAQAVAWMLPAMDPVALPFTSSGGNLVCNVTTAWRDAMGYSATPATASFGTMLAGVIVQISAATLNQVPGFTFTMTTAFDSFMPTLAGTQATKGVNSNTMLVETPGGVDVVLIRQVFARMAGGRPRFQPANLAIPPTGTLNSITLTLSGLPANYSAALFLPQPADAKWRPFFQDAE